MNAAETIAKAIEKLEAHKEEIRSKGPWWVQKKSEALGGYWIRGLGDEVVGELFWKSDAHLVVTLHRTIDAQLAVLQQGLRSIAAWQDPDSWAGYEPPIDPEVPDTAEPIVALATAILGGNQ